MHTRIVHYLGGLAMALAVAGFSSALRAVTADDADPPANPDPIPALVRANNLFALEVYRQFAPAPGENVFFSPYSVSTALAMTRAGARGQTETQMAQALRLASLPQGQAATTFGTLQRKINETETKAGVRLAVANSLWPQHDHPLLPDYVKTVETDFASAIFPVNYQAQSEAARLRINQWVEAKTNDRIKDLLHPGDVNAGTRLVLVNAIYFKGDWAEQFDPAETENAPFTLANGGAKNTALMRKKMSVRYADFAGGPVPLQIAALPYKNGALEFVVLLPRAAGALPDLEKNLTADQLAAWLGQLSRPREVDVFLPKFKLTERYDLIPPLKKLGMVDAFTGAADFSGMDGARDLAISGVIHQAFIEVNEEGTEAAAATGVVMLALAVQPIIFRADHPFLFFIRDTATGSLLFMGRFASPPAGN